MGRRDDFESVRRHRMFSAAHTHTHGHFRSVARLMRPAADALASGWAAVAPLRRAARWPLLCTTASLGEEDQAPLLFFCAPQCMTVAFFWRR